MTAAVRFETNPAAVGRVGRRGVDRGSLRLLQTRDDSGVLGARGEINGTAVIGFATDATRMGGAMGEDGCRHVVDAIDTATGGACG